MKPQFTITEALVEADAPQWIVLRYDWLECVAWQLGAISKLPDGWDGDGAIRPDSRSLKAAWGLLQSICRADGVTKPHVNPTRSGGVQFEWENGARYFEIEVVAERAASYLYRDTGSCSEDTGEIFERESLHQIIQYIRQAGAGVSRSPSRESKSALGYEILEAVR